jgi:predicted RNA-binding Zn-ribbon protein involved in translation (DUF1610 family)
MKDAGPKAFLQRWAIQIVCKDCDATYQFDEPNVGDKLMPRCKRWVLIGAPEVCPSCKNLKSIPPKDAA